MADDFRELIQGSEAAKNGGRFEDEIEGWFLLCDIPVYDNPTYQKLKKANKLPAIYVVKQVQYTKFRERLAIKFPNLKLVEFDPEDKIGRMDFVLYITLQDDSTKRINIEAKTQTSDGTAEEKINNAVLNVQYEESGSAGIIVLNGEKLLRQKEYIRLLAKQDAWRQYDLHANKVSIMSIDEFVYYITDIA